MKNSCLKEYINVYDKLLRKRCELDARIDFITQLIESYDKSNAVDFKIEYFDAKGKLIREVNSKYV